MVNNGTVKMDFLRERERERGAVHFGLENTLDDEIIGLNRR